MKQLAFFLFFALLIAGSKGVSGQAAEGEKLSQEKIEAGLLQRNEELRGISNVFAEQQKKTALLKRDRAMLAQDAADPMLSEEDRQKLQEKIARVESEMDRIEVQRVQNRASFASAAKDYEVFAKANLSEESFQD